MADANEWALRTLDGEIIVCEQCGECPATVVLRHANVCDECTPRIPLRVTVFVEGHRVANVHVPAGAQVLVKDYDALDVNVTLRDENGLPYTPSLWNGEPLED